MNDQDRTVENIRVAVRCRPMNEREKKQQAASCFTAQDGHAVLSNPENPQDQHR